MNVALDGSYDGVAVLPHRDGARIVLFGAGGSSARDRDGLALAALPPMRGAVVADIDGDGARDLVTCGDGGLVVLGWESVRDPLAIDAAPCRAIARVGDTLATIDTSLHLWSLSGGVVLDRGPSGAFIAGEPYLAVGEGVLTVASSGSARIVERRGGLRSEYAAGGTPSGLATTRAGVVWTLAEGTLTNALHATWDAGPAPGRVIVARAAADETIYVLGGDGAVRKVVAGGRPIALPGEPTRALAAGDLDGDGCDELIRVGLRLAIDAGCRPIEAVVPVDRAPVVPVASVPAASAPPIVPKRTYPRLLGLTIPPSIGADPLDRTPDHWGDRTVGVGLAVGGGLSEIWPFIPAFPIIAFESTSGPPHFRTLFGVDTAGFLLWIGPNVAVAHLVNATFGVAFGGRDLQFGPIASIGLVGAGAGVRAVWTPFPAGRDVGQMGLETRLVAYLGGAGEVDVMWVWRYPARRNLDRRVPIGGRPACEELAFEAGVAGGFSSTDNAWEFVGRVAPYSVTASPALAVACDGKRASLSIETAPTFSWLAPPDRERVHHLASVTMGPLIGEGALRYGPIGTLGIWTAGIGGRALIRPFEDEAGRRQGLDVRAVALLPYGPAWEATVMWGVWTDPVR